MYIIRLRRLRSIFCDKRESSLIAWKRVFVVTDKVGINDSELVVKCNSHEIKLTAWVFQFFAIFGERVTCGKRVFWYIREMTVCNVLLFKKLIKVLTPGKIFRFIENSILPSLSFASFSHQFHTFVSISSSIHIKDTYTWNIYLVLITLITLVWWAIYYLRRIIYYRSKVI